MTHTLLSSIKSSDVIYRSLTNDLDIGILSCGFMKKENKNRSQYNFSIGYYSCFLLLAGSGTYSDESGMKHTLKSGSVVQRLPGVIHSTEVDPDGKWLEFYISVGKPVFEYLKTLGLLRTETPVFSINYTEDIIRSFIFLLEKLKKAEESLLPSLLFEAQQQVVFLHEKSFMFRSPVEQAVHAASDLLNSRFDEDISLEEIAKVVHMGYENLRKAFKHITGVSLARYRIEKRIKYAQLLLLSGCSIKETAVRSGYQDIYSFSKQFKKTTNLSPGMFLKKEGM